MRKTGKFHDMTKEMDETEHRFVELLSLALSLTDRVHSIEMHLPYICKIFGSSVPFPLPSSQTDLSLQSTHHPRPHPRWIHLPRQGDVLR
jgi:hypothetical protein